MALPFQTAELLRADLESKPGVYATDLMPVADETDKFKRYDLQVLREVVDADGVSRYVTTTQSVVEDLTDNSFGYGNNRQWDKIDKSETTLKDELEQEADAFEGQTVGGKTVLSVSVQSVDQSSSSGIVLAYFTDGTSLQAIFKKDSQGNWTKQPLSSV